MHEASYSIAGHAFSTAPRDCNPRPPPCDIPSRTRILSVKPHAQTQHMGRQLGSTARVCSRQPGGSHSCRSVWLSHITWWRSWTIRLQRLPTHRTASEQPACCQDNHQRGLSCPRDILAQSTGMALAFALCDALSCPHAEHDATCLARCGLELHHVWHVISKPRLQHHAAPHTHTYHAQGTSEPHNTCTWR